MTFIAVDDVDAACRNTGKAGGRILKQSFEVPGVERIAMITGPSGATDGRITPAQQC